MAEAEAVLLRWAEGREERDGEGEALLQPVPVGQALGVEEGVGARGEGVAGAVAMG